MNPPKYSMLRDIMRDIKLRKEANAPQNVKRRKYSSARQNVKRRISASAQQKTKRLKTLSNTLSTPDNALTARVPAEFNNSGLSKKSQLMKLKII